LAWRRTRKNRSFTSYSATATNGWSRPSGGTALLNGLVHSGITRPRLIGLQINPKHGLPFDGSKISPWSLGRAPMRSEISSRKAHLAEAPVGKATPVKVTRSAAYHFLLLVA